MTDSCPYCFSFFIRRDYRQIYCSRRCQKNNKNHRRRMVTADSRVRDRKRTEKDNKQSAMLRSIRENRKVSEKALIEQISYLSKRNSELKQELKRLS